MRAPVLVRGIRLGEVESVLVDATASRVVGLDVRCGDGSNRFLPYSTARLAGAAVEIDSTLTLLDNGELSFYRSHARRLEEVPELSEAFVGPDGALVVGLPARC